MPLDHWSGRGRMLRGKISTSMASFINHVKNKRQKCMDTTPTIWTKKKKGALLLSLHAESDHLGTDIVKNPMILNCHKALFNILFQLRPFKILWFYPLQHSSVLPWRWMMPDWWPSVSWKNSKQCWHSALRWQTHARWPPLHLPQTWCSTTAFSN